MRNNFISFIDCAAHGSVSIYTLSYTCAVGVQICAIGVLQTIFEIGATTKTTGAIVMKKSRKRNQKFFDKHQEKLKTLQAENSTSSRYVVMEFQFIVVLEHRVDMRWTAWKFLKNLLFRFAASLIRGLAARVPGSSLLELLTLSVVWMLPSLHWKHTNSSCCSLSECTVCGLGLDNPDNGQPKVFLLYPDMFLSVNRVKK